MCSGVTTNDPAQFLRCRNQRIEAEQGTVLFGYEDTVRVNELRSNCQVVLPVFEPMFGIAPMFFSVVGNAG